MYLKNFKLYCSTFCNNILLIDFTVILYISIALSFFKEYFEIYNIGNNKNYITTCIIINV